MTVNLKAIFRILSFLKEQMDSKRADLSGLTINSLRCVGGTMDLVHSYDE